MEANDMSGRMLPGMASGLLGLEMPLHQHQHQHQQQLHFPHHQQPHQQLVSYPTHEAKSQQSIKQNNYPYPNKSKQQHLSDEDENGYNVEDGGDDGKKKISPWHRMKWTDNMIRLLIMAVYYIGDDCSIDANDTSCTIKKKGGGVVLQKKGKWKSVSKAMMEKGFYVSPQQCEDKFNDLNKRYKRVNDILGKGTACRVVENQSLLDTMDHLTTKLKEEVRKLLNSKHLFFREMCAYHNSGGGGGNVGGNQWLEAAAESSHHQQQQHCFHSPENGSVGANPKNRLETEGLKTVNGGREVVDVDDEDEDDDDNEDEEDDNDDEEETEGGSGGGRHEINGDENELVSRKRKRREMFSSPLMKQMSCELVGVLQDGTKSPWERRQWMLSRMFQLEEQKVSCQYQAFELEKQRVKWLKFSAKKEREMERMKLNNERMRLENERMVLLLRNKELELLHRHQQQQSSNKRPDPSSLAG
ncbi:sequence-specific DNA binding transcription factor [Thalictrum thalictroides]|uniref:Sequence-specific DNA binding transcription factor n=1 Tax=Thalictrum thalictroides TaxID=46969 RepID=A0A7J6W5R4_THATH|nr:sequence-specific DNA binding transcription factor [Thalictrum thalictroides]